MRSPLQNGIRWDLPPLPGTPPLIDEERDDYHIESCLKAGGFPRAVRIGHRAAWVYPEQRR